MKPPTTILANHGATKPSRRTQTDTHSCNPAKLRSGSVADEYGAACEGGLYRPAQSNVVKVKNAGTQTDWDDVSDGDHFAILSDEEDEGPEIEEVEFASRRNSAGRLESIHGLGDVGDEAIGGVPAIVMDVLDGINHDYEIVIEPDRDCFDIVAGSVRRIRPPRGQQSATEETNQ